MKVRRGDVFWIDEVGGRRPVCVLTRDSAIPLLHRVVVAPATRTIRGAPTEVRLGRADGMPEECVLSLDNIRVIPKRALKKRITAVSTERLEEVCEALSYAIGC